MELICYDLRLEMYDKMEQEITRNIESISSFMDLVQREIEEAKRSGNLQTVHGMTDAISGAVEEMLDMHERLADIAVCRMLEAVNRETWLEKKPMIIHSNWIKQ